MGHGFEWPEITGRILIGVLAVGFPIAVALPWYHGHEGLTRISAGEMTVVAMLLVVGAGVLMVLVRTPLGHAQPRPDTSQLPLACTSAPILPAPALSVPQRWAAGASELDHALALAPGSARILLLHGLAPAALGQWDAARRDLNASIARDPLLPAAHFLRGSIELGAGNSSEAQSSLNRALNIAPDYALAHFTPAEALLFNGQKQAALGQIELEPIEVARWAGRAAIDQALGRRADSDAALKKLIEQTAQPNAPYFIAGVHAYRGESDSAFRWLERSFTHRDPGWYRIKGGLFLHPVRQDPRYKAFLRKMKLPG